MFRVFVNQLQSGWESWDVATDPSVSEQRKVGRKHLLGLCAVCLWW